MHSLPFFIPLINTTTPTDNESTVQTQRTIYLENEKTKVKKYNDYTNKIQRIGQYFLYGIITQANVVFFRLLYTHKYTKSQNGDKVILTTLHGKISEPRKTKLATIPKYDNTAV